MTIERATPESTRENLSAVSGWIPVCAASALEPERGIAVLIEGEPFALFKVHNGANETIYGVSHIDPRTESPTIARGLVGSASAEPVVISPLLKDRFSLVGGHCLNDPDLSLEVLDVTVSDHLVYVRRNVTAGKQA